jgi:broad specificity phosphatase PhoE
VRVVQHHRHSMRGKPGQHLNQAGVELARRVGGALGRFDRVITSRLPRAFETALAMGYAVDEQREELSSTPEGLAAELDWREGCPGFQRVARAGGVVARYVAEQAALMHAIAAALPENGRALVVSHGGIVEAGAVGCRPDHDFSAWGRACGYCEGIRLTFDANLCVAADLLRVPGSLLES